LDIEFAFLATASHTSDLQQSNSGYRPYRLTGGVTMLLVINKSYRVSV
jgi:hypothetical protein